MGFAKLREWVGTMTGKGVRWGRDRIGRSAPAFMAASTPALPHLPARRKADIICGSCCFCCENGQLWGVCSLRPVPGGESAGCVCLQCLFCRLCACLPAANFACHAHCPSQHLAPHSRFISPVHLLKVALPPSISFCSVCLCFACHLFMSMCARIIVSQGRRFVVSQGQQFASCETAP